MWEKKYFKLLLSVFKYAYGLYDYRLFHYLEFNFKQQIMTTFYEKIFPIIFLLQFLRKKSFSVLDTLYLSPQSLLEFML